MSSQSILEMNRSGQKKKKRWRTRGPTLDWLREVGLPGYPLRDSTPCGWATLVRQTAKQNSTSVVRPDKGSNATN